MRISWVVLLEAGGSGPSKPLASAALVIHNSIVHFQHVTRANNHHCCRKYRRKLYLFSEYLYVRCTNTTILNLYGRHTKRDFVEILVSSHFAQSHFAQSQFAQWARVRGLGVGVRVRVRGGVRVRRWHWAKWDWANWDWAKWDWAKWDRTEILAHCGRGSLTIDLTACGTNRRRSFVAFAWHSAPCNCLCKNNVLDVAVT